MKKNFLAIAAACLIAALGAGSAQAQELDKNATPAQIAAFEKEHFITFDAKSVNGDAKAAQALINATGEGAEGSDAKCWFWGWRYYYYPSYYYYTWYCPCYHVPLRLVTYTVPVTTTTTTVVTTPGAAANVEVQQQQVQQPQQQNQQQQQQQQQQDQTQGQSAAQSNSVDPNTVAIAKSTGRMACGAVVDQTVPQNSPLKKMGVKVGDVITHVDGVQVKSLHDLQKIKLNSKLTVVPGSSISVSKKQINHTPSAKGAQELENGMNGEGLTELNIGEDKIGENETVSLYEYYEALEKGAK